MPPEVSEYRGNKCRALSDYLSFCLFVRAGETRWKQGLESHSSKQIPGALPIHGMHCSNNNTRYSDENAVEPGSIRNRNI